MIRCSPTIWFKSRTRPFRILKPKAVISSNSQWYFVPTRECILAFLFKKAFQAFVFCARASRIRLWKVCGRRRRRAMRVIFTTTRQWVQPFTICSLIAIGCTWPKRKAWSTPSLATRFTSNLARFKNSRHVHVIFLECENNVQDWSVLKRSLRGFLEFKNKRIVLH